jgi:hypothetical protein
MRALKHDHGPFRATLNHLESELNLLLLIRRNHKPHIAHFLLSYPTSSQSSLIISAPFSAIM